MELLQPERNGNRPGAVASGVYFILVLVSFQAATFRSLKLDSWYLPNKIHDYMETSLATTHRSATITASTIIMVDEDPIAAQMQPKDKDMTRKSPTTAGVDTNTLVADSSTVSSRYERIVAELESVSLRYYMYDNANITYPEVIEQLQKLGQGVSPGVLSMFDALEKHHLRTFDPNEADFYIVPIFFDALYSKHQSYRRLQQAMGALMDSPLFNATHGKRHVYFGIGGRMFGYTCGGPGPLLIRNNMTYRSAIANGIVVKDVDMVECEKMAQNKETHRDWKKMFYTWRPISPATFSVGFMPGKDMPLIRPSYEKFASSHWTFFYHTRVAGSVCNSTVYRHAPLTLLGGGNITAATHRDLKHNNNYGNKKNVFDDILNTSSIGFDIAAEEWKSRFVNSKFCLVIRGDDPGSRAFLRSLRAGCIPVVASDYLERFSPTLKATLRFSDFAIFVDEQAFVNNPGLEMRKVLREYTDKAKLLEKIEGAVFAQRVAFPDHPQSLFVPAFLKQAMLALPAEEQMPLQQKVKKTELAQVVGFKL